MQINTQVLLVAYRKVMELFSVFIIVVITTTLLVVRVLYVISQSSKPVRNTSQKHLRTLVVLGSVSVNYDLESRQYAHALKVNNFNLLAILVGVFGFVVGGHTAEMINLLLVMQKDRYAPRFYIAAATDNMSLQKARVFEETLDDKASLQEPDSTQFMQIYRSREVGQSYITSVGTTLYALGHGLWLMLKIRPQVILCNGPGTCIPICAIAFMFKVLGFRWSYIFYLESIARVKRLSLSGLFLYKLRMADQLFVQWPQLQKQYPRAYYVGRLM